MLNYREMEIQHSSSEPTPTPTPTPTYCKSESESESESEGRRLKVNVGGKTFETLESTLSFSPTTSSEPIFIDRDPQLFSSILSLLRNRNRNRKHIPSRLISESRLYGVDISPFVGPPPFSPFDASLVTSLRPPCSPLVSAFSASNNKSPILLAHSGLVSSYDPLTLSLDSCIPTHVHQISSVASISDSHSHDLLLAFGSHSSSGLHLYSSTLHLRTLFWVDHSDSRLDKSRVSAVAPSGSLLSAAFHSHHGENAVLLIDNHTLNVVSEIGRQSGNSAKSSPVNKMRWVPSLGLLVASSVNSAAFGYSGYVRLWDPRSGDIVWDTHEPGSGRRLGDTMADVDVDPHRLFLAKVGSKSGDLGVADLRKLGPDPWLYLEDPNPPNWKPGCSVVLHCYQGNVIVSRDGELEAWSTTTHQHQHQHQHQQEHSTWGMYRRFFVDKLHHSHPGIITNIQGAANTLFLTRANVEGVEVWQTSPSSAVHTIV